MVRALAGEVSGDGVTDAADVAIVRTMNSQPLAPDNARLDLNLDGHINLIDVALAKGTSGSSATCP